MTNAIQRKMSLLESKRQKTIIHSPRFRCHRLTAGTRLGGKGASEPLHLAQTSSARDDGRVGQRTQGESIPEEVPVPNSLQGIVPP